MLLSAAGDTLNPTSIVLLLYLDTNMSDKKEKKRKKQRDNDDAGFARLGSGVDYSKVANRHVDDDRYEKHHKAITTSPPPPQDTKMSSQMEAVYRLMTGKEERTIAEKLADSNRPTWEQYKKDNEDKLNLEGLDQRKMEEYRKELDLERERILARGINHGADKKKKKKRKKKKHYSSDSDSSDDDSSKRRHKKKHKKKKDRKRKKRHHSSESESSDSSRDDDSHDDHRRKRHKKKKKKKPDQKVDDRYRLSNFFTKGSDEED